VPPDAKALGLTLRRLKAAEKRRNCQFSICFSAHFSGRNFSRIALASGEQQLLFNNPLDSLLRLVDAVGNADAAKGAAGDV
jgi:hypothetical protein